LARRDPETLRRYSLSSLLTIFQKCDAVAFAQPAKLIIHSRSQTENIMVGDYGEVLVMDWGAADSRSKAALISRQFAEPARPPRTVK
jgi:hypothetical protein